MSGTNAQATDLQNDFAEGRKQVFDFIKERLTFNSNRHAAKIMNDVFGVEHLMDDAFDLNDMIQTSSQKLYGEIENMLHVLAAGENVYTLTGRDKIPTYTRITGGDINAGRLSAAQDFSIMLLSVDLKHITHPFADKYMRKKELFVMPDNVKMALGYSNGRIIDDILHGVETDIIEKLPRPEIIGYEGAEPAPPRPARLGGVFSAVAKKARMKGSFESRFARVPKSWPPFQGAPDMRQTISVHSAMPQIIAPPDFQAVANDTPDFAAAQKAYLKEVYTELQAQHFEATRSDHDYAKRVGLPATWERAVTDIAEELFFDLRTTIAERLSGSAIGAGETAQDGIKAAQDWLAHELVKLDIPSRYPESRNQQVAAEHLVAFWQETARKQAPSAQPPQKQVQPRALKR